MSKSSESDLLNSLSIFSTPVISDALDGCGFDGLIKDIYPIVPAGKVIGPVYTILYEPYDRPGSSFEQASNYIDEVPKGMVVLIDNHGDLSCSVWGGILTHYAKHSELIGTIVHGAIRDVEAVSQSGYSVFASGVTPRTGKGRSRMIDKKCPLSIGSVNIEFQDIVFADKHGVLIIPRKLLSKVLTMSKNIVANEKCIMNKISQGISLKEARQSHHYEQPWLVEPKGK